MVCEEGAKDIACIIFVSVHGERTKCNLVEVSLEFVRRVHDNDLGDLPNIPSRLKQSFVDE